MMNDEALNSQAINNPQDPQAEDLTLIFKKHQEQFNNKQLLDVQERIDLLKNLKIQLQEEAENLAWAINQDFSHRAIEETYLLEIFPTIKAIEYCIKKLPQWIKREKKRVPWYLQPATAYIFPQPLGVVGIMVPWNYPLLLSLVPLSYAIAAGNQVLLKMSELTPQLGQILSQNLTHPRFKQNIAVFNGGLELSKAFVKLPFNHLLFTGSTSSASAILAASSNNLVPVTLELGGKSPAIISTSMDAKKLICLFMGKVFNAGQTCLAPDYLLVPIGWEEEIERQFKIFVAQYYPNLLENPQYSAIISAKHTLRLQALIEDAQSQGARVVFCGGNSFQQQKIPICLVFNVKASMKILQEEIFGPILPIMMYETIEEAVSYINSQPKPLSIYYFGKNKAERKFVEKHTSSGGFTVNDTMSQCAVDDLPFGGIGPSGMGAYHGKKGFETFSHLKPVFIKKPWGFNQFVYPPYGICLRVFLRLLAGLRLKRN